MIYCHGMLYDLDIFCIHGKCAFPRRVCGKCPFPLLFSLSMQWDKLHWDVDSQILAQETEKKISCFHLKWKLNTFKSFFYFRVRLFLTPVVIKKNVLQLAVFSHPSNSMSQIVPSRHRASTAISRWKSCQLYISVPVHWWHGELGLTWKRCLKHLWV